MAVVFEETVLSGVRLRNRFIRSATYEGLATEDGLVTPALIEAMKRLAEGEVGLIITGHSYISPEGKAAARKMSMASDEAIANARSMTDAVHNAGGKIFVQLAHAGAQAADPTAAIGPSPILKNNAKTVCREMTLDDIRRVTELFIAAAERGKKAGFDGIQLHAAHGYLLSEFLSPYYNRRSDAYGGSAENRVRLLLDILRGVKTRVGQSFPVMVKLNSEDFVDGGLTVDDALGVCAALEKNGVDAIEFSGGMADSREGFDPVRKGDPVPDAKPYYLEAARRYKAARFKTPLALVGGVRSLEIAERTVSENLADYIALCRPLVREPGLIKRWRQGDRRRADCVSCNRCFRPIVTGKGFACAAIKK